MIETLSHCLIVLYCELLHSQNLLRRSFFTQTFWPKHAVDQQDGKTCIKHQTYSSRRQLHMSMHTRTHTKRASNFYFCSRGTFVTGVIRAECVLTPSQQTTPPNLSHAAPLGHTERPQPAGLSLTPLSSCHTPPGAQRLLAAL